jgi:DNA-binding transcriptional ArsR family regulator
MERKNTRLEHHNRVVGLYSTLVERLKIVSAPTCRLILEKRKERGEVTIEELSRCIPAEMQIKSDIPKIIFDLTTAIDEFKRSVIADEGLRRALTNLQTDGVGHH